MPLDPGTRIGRYEILAPLGAGGMGEVYRARDTKLERDVALKVLPDDVARDFSRLRRFEQEARAVAALNHPNIVGLYDVGEGYLIAELVDGDPVAGPVSLPRALDVAAQIAEGLAAAHEAGIVHRDLKPANVLLRRDGRVKILDFGLAKVDARGAAEAAASASSTATMETQPGVVMGTAGYMSPEQVRGAPLDSRSDIFNVGLILYELLAGERAFRGGTGVEVMAAILNQVPPALPDSLPAAVRKIVHRCLEKRREDRFQSAADLAFSLRSCLDADRPTAAPVVRRRSWTLAAVVAVGCVAIGLTAGLLIRGSMPPPESWTQTRMGGPETAWRPRLSPDGRTLAMLTMVNGQSQVAVMRPESGDWSILTREADQGPILRLSWSPDGSRIYYDRTRSIPSGIYSVPVIGGQPRLVLENAGTPEALPDGSMVVGRYNSRGQFQACRFWPDTGKTQEYPFELTWDNGHPLRAFPGGREAAVLGTPIPAPEGLAGARLYALDLTTGVARPIYTERAFQSGALSITPDGRSVIFTDYGSGVRSIAATGAGPARTLFPLPSRIFTVDAAPDGSVLTELIERTPEMVVLTGGRTQRLISSPLVGPELHFTTLSDGRAVWAQGVAGRNRLIALTPGSQPETFVTTSDATSTPAAQLGREELAFLLGPPGRREIAVASLSTGRLVRRIPFDKGEITAMSAPDDGRTLYCVAGPAIWAVPATPEGGPIRRVADGNGVAADPDGRYLAVVFRKDLVTRLHRVPLDGGAPVEVEVLGGYRPTRQLGARALARDGRLLNGLWTTDSWFYVPGIIDMKTGRVTQAPTDLRGDYYAMNWTHDGQIMSIVSPFRSSIWKFSPERR